MSQVMEMFQDLVRLQASLADSVEDRLLSDFQLPLGRFQVLRVIEGQRSCRVGDIADELGITWGGTSKLVDRLEASALCRRRPNPEDKRSSLITLTPAGARLLARAQAAAEAELEQCVGPLVGSRTLTQLAAALTEVRAGIDDHLRHRTA